MGTWGPAIFSDDTACDLRDRWMELVGDGLSGVEATDRLLAECGGLAEDPEDGPVFWCALAATQSKAGRLEDRVRDRALEFIRSGADLARWDEDPAGRKQRARHLEKLADTLTGPQPRPRKIRAKFRSTCDWAVGEVIGYQLASGRFVAFRVLGHHVDRGGTSPVVELLDWVGDTLDALPDPDGLGTRGRGAARMMIGATSARELPTARVHRTGRTARTPRSEPPYSVTLWRTLDANLESWFELR